MDTKNTLFKLLECFSPAGYEKNQAELFKKLIEPYADEVKIDKFYNAVAIKKSSLENAKKIMLDAHIDHVALTVTEVCENGFLRFVANGIDTRTLAAKEVLVFGKKQLTGVITTTPPHLKEDIKKSQKADEMFIDTGLFDKAGELVRVGDVACIKASAIDMGDVVSGTAIDNKAGLLALIMALEMLKDIELPFDLYAVGSVQEEFNALGARVKAYDINPDLSIVVDVTHAKTPDSKDNGTFAFDGGVLIGMGPNLHKNETKSLIEVAKSKQIGYGIEVMEGSTGTNAWYIQVAREGVKTLLLSIPLKYMHTAVETINIKTIEAVARLIASFIIKKAGEAND